jgi:hypothetical protein
MYLRTIQRRNRDGSVVRYLRLAITTGSASPPRPKCRSVSAWLDRLDVEGLRQLFGSIGRYLDGARGLPAASPVDGAATSGLVVESTSRRYENSQADPSQSR